MIIIAFILVFIAIDIALAERTLIRLQLLRYCLSCSVMLALLSFLYTLSLFVGLSAWLFEILVMLPPLTYIIYNRRILNARRAVAHIKNLPVAVMTLSLGILLWFNYQYFASVVRWGEWDAWAIWSQHARFLTDAANFDNLFSSELSWTHPDYPLMLPSIIAMLWNSFGFSAYIPAIIAWVITILLLLVMTGSLYEKGRIFLGILLLFLITCFKVMFPFVVSQYADTLLALFILLPFVVVNHTPPNKPLTYLLLTGFFAACCAWIKNEGLAFFVFFSMCYVVYNYKDFRAIRFYVLGALFPLSVLILFKLMFPFPSDFGTDPDAAWGKLNDTYRYEVLLDYGYNWFSQNAQLLWVCMIAILLINYRYYFSLPFVVILLLAGSYFLVYIITPFDLPWHLSTSFDRLVHQIMPVLLYSMFMSAGGNATLSTYAGRRFKSLRIRRK